MFQVWPLPRCYELAGNKRVEFNYDDQSYMKPSENQYSKKTEVYWDQALHSPWWSPEGRSGSPIYIFTDEQISKHFGKASIQDERVCVLQLELVETTSLLKKEEMTLRLGGSTDVLLIYGQSFFKFKKWSKMSSSFPIWKVVWDLWRKDIFKFEKWFRSNNHLRNKNGLIDCWCTIDNDSPCGQCGGMV